MAGETAGDRYRVQVFRGSIFSFIARRAAPRVVIIDADGREVWSRTLKSSAEAAPLIEVIESQVFTAGLEEFEHWLRTEGASGSR